MATYAVKYYRSIGHVADYDNMKYVNILADFKTDNDAYSLLWKQNPPDTRFVSNKDNEKNIIKWVPIFEDALLCTFWSKGILVYVIHESTIVSDVTNDPLDADSHYGAAGFLLE